jgi:hypothetical protein
MLSNLYNQLTAYGTVYRLDLFLENPKKFVDWTEENFDYVKYNYRKDINRLGLSVTSLDGGVTGVPDLDSLLEYNTENNTDYTERDFKTFTPVYNYPQLQKCLEPIKDHIFRTHILKLETGGFFPAHRDNKITKVDSFRILVPLSNTNPPNFTFVIDGKIEHWVEGAFYFIDTLKTHYLFNASFKPTYMLVVNVDLNEDTIKFISDNLAYL